VNPILNGADPVFEYDRGSLGPSQAGQASAQGGGLLEPSAVGGGPAR
jgi:hypothetical protein